MLHALVSKPFKAQTKAGAPTITTGGDNRHNRIMVSLTNLLTFRLYRIYGIKGLSGGLGCFGVLPSACNRQGTMDNDSTFKHLKKSSK